MNLVCKQRFITSHAVCQGIGRRLSCSRSFHLRHDRHRSLIHHDTLGRGERFRATAIRRRNSISPCRCGIKRTTSRNLSPVRVLHRVGYTVAQARRHTRWVVSCRPLQQRSLQLNRSVPIGHAVRAVDHQRLLLGDHHVDRNGLARNGTHVLFVTLIRRRDRIHARRRRDPFGCRLTIVSNRRIHRLAAVTDRVDDLEHDLAGEFKPRLTLVARRSGQSDFFSFLVGLLRFDNGDFVFSLYQVINVNVIVANLQLCCSLNVRSILVVTTLHEPEVNGRCPLSLCRSITAINYNTAIFNFVPFSCGVGYSFTLAVRTARTTVRSITTRIRRFSLICILYFCCWIEGVIFCHRTEGNSFLLHRLCLLSTLSSCRSRSLYNIGQLYVFLFFRN